MALKQSHCEFIPNASFVYVTPPYTQWLHEIKKKKVDEAAVGRDSSSDSRDEMKKNRRKRQGDAFQDRMGSLRGRSGILFPALCAPTSRERKEEDILRDLGW